MPQTLKLRKKATYRSKSTPYQKFLDSLRNEATTQAYTHYLKEFLKFTKLQSYDRLAELTYKEMSEAIQDYINYQVRTRKLSTSTITGSNAAIRIFCDTNGIESINWRRLSRLKGKHKLVVKDRPYSEEELKRLLEYADIREKVAILTMLSTGIRVGALSTLKVGDIQKIPLPLEFGEQQIYKFEVYSDENENYTTFCTPECAKMIDMYLEDRKNTGEDITNESPFITYKINPDYKFKEKGFLDTRTIQRILERQRSVANLKPSIVIGAEAFKIKKTGKGKQQLQEKSPLIRRTGIMRTHAFRKFFNTMCVEKNVNNTVKEALMGHKCRMGLDRHYYRPKDWNSLLKEYVKVIDVLTVNDENRLRLRTEQLQKEVEEIKDIRKELDKKDKQINQLNKSLKSIRQFQELLADNPDNRIVFDEQTGTLKGRIIKRTTHKYKK